MDGYKRNVLSFNYLNSVIIYQNNDPLPLFR